VNLIYESPILITGAELVFHLTIRAYTDPIQHLAMTTGLISFSSEINKRILLCIQSRGIPGG